MRFNSRQEAQQRLARTRRVLTEWEYEAAHYALAAEGILHGRPASPLVLADCVQLADTVAAELGVLRAMQVGITRSNSWELADLLARLEALALNLVGVLSAMRGDRP